MLSFLKNNLFNNQRNQLILIVVLTSLVFLNSLSNRILWDDHLFLENWPAITSYQNTAEILKGSAPPSQDKIFRPVRGLIWLLDYQTFGANPLFYHLQALLIHLSATILVYFITLTIIQNSKFKIQNSKLLTFNIELLPFLTALFFGVHPIHTETINYISASLETFGSLFFFASFYLYLKSSQKPFAIRHSPFVYQIGSILFAGLAFFTYEMTLTLPILIILYELIIIKTKLNLKSIGSRIYSIAGIGIVALIYLLIRFVILQIGSRTDYLAYSFYHTMLTMVQIFIRYIFLLLFPINQTAIHNLAGEFPSSMIQYDKLDPILNLTIFDTPVLLSILAIGGLITLAVKLRNEFPVISFAICWFFVSLLPVSYIIPHGGAMAEKYLYIASFGFLIGVVYSGYLGYGYLLLKFKITRPSKGGQNSKIKIMENILAVILIIIISLFSILTITRNAVWKDDISLFSDVVKKSPGNLMANYTLGIWYGKYNYFDESAAYFKKALEKSPEFWEARYNLGLGYIKQSKFDEAKNEYSEIVQLYPDHTPAKNVLENINLIKESTPSVTPSGDILVSYNKNPNFEFGFPLNWRLERQKNKLILNDPGNSFSVEIEEDDNESLMEDYLNSQVESTASGSLINQGLAKIPNVDEAYVKAYNLNNQTKLQFYLFKGEKVIKVSAYPADSGFMGSFDQILGSINIK